MSISFFPLGVVFSSSAAINTGLAAVVPVGGTPTTASLVQYVVNYTGPTGPAYITRDAVRVQ